MTSRADFSVVWVSCATNLQSFGSSLSTPPPPQSVGIVVRRRFVASSSRARRRVTCRAPALPPVTADVSILTRRDIRHPRSHLFFTFRLPPLSLFLSPPRRLPPNRFVIPPPVGGDVFLFLASFKVISHPPTSSHQQIQAFPLRQGCRKLGEKNKRNRPQLSLLAC